MLTVVLIACAVWLTFSFLLVWFSTFNWLVANRIFSLDMSALVYARSFLITPIVASLLLTEGVVNRLLDYFCKEK